MPQPCEETSFSTRFDDATTVLALPRPYGIEPHVHVAILKYWYERWGAEVVAATAGDLELQALRPPTTPEAALELAKEQYMYCRDLVDQNTRSVAVLAKLLLSSPVWWFWWD
jgi:hypothetical protein